MAEGFVEIPPDSTGKKLRTAELTVGGNDVHQEIITLADAAGNILSPGLPLSRDAANEQSSNLGANATFTGTFVKIDEYESIILSWYSLQQPASFTIQFSADGATVDTNVTQVIQPVFASGFWTIFAAFNPAGNKYYRVIVVNGTTAQTFVAASNIFSPAPYTGQYQSLGNLPSSASPALLTRAVLGGLRPDGNFANVDLTETNALAVGLENASATASGSIFTESMRDDVAIDFQKPNSLALLTTNQGTGGTATLDSTQGQVIFDTGATAGNSATFRSISTVYSAPGHMVRTGMNVHVSALPTGNAYVEWGLGDANNALGYRLDSTGLHVFRRKVGTLVENVLQSSWNRDQCLGATSSGFIFNGAPQVLNVLNDNFYRTESETLGPGDFWVKSPNKSWINTHTIEFPNQHIGSILPSLNLPLYVDVHNDTTSGGSIQIRCSSWRAGTTTSYSPTSSRDQGNEQTVALSANTSMSAANGSITVGSTAITTGTNFFSPSMSGLGITDTLGFIPAATTLTYVSTTSATLSQAAVAPPTTSAAFGTSTSSIDQFKSALAPPSGAVFTGQFRNVVQAQALIALWASTAQPSSVVVQWSPDGINPDTSLLGSSTLAISQTAGYYVGLMINNGTQLQPYYRVVVTNGPVAQSGTPGTQVSLNLLMNTPYTGSFAGLNSQLSLLSNALLTRSVIAGTDPGGTFTNLPFGGHDSSNATSTALVGSATYRGTWFNWQQGYTKMVCDMTSDVSGTLYIDFSEALIPTNGDDTSIDYSIVLPYNPLTEKLLRRSTPVQSRFYRLRYVNGLAAQTSFFLDTALFTSDPGLPAQALQRLPLLTTEAGIIRNVPAVGDGTGNNYHELPVDGSGIPETHVTTFDPDVLLRPLNNWQVKQQSVSISAVQLDPVPMANRRLVQVTNQDAAISIYLGPNSSVLESSGELVAPLSSSSMMLSGSGQVWGICHNAGGVQTTYDRSPTSASGTATSPTNVEASDATYATATNTQTVTASAYTNLTSNPISSIKIGVRGLKSTSPATETTAFVDVVTATGGNVGTLVTGSVTANANHFYVVAISRRNTSATVTSVTGMGLTWTQFGADAINTNNAIVSLYYATGTGSTTGAVTVNLSATATNIVVAVSRYSNVNFSSPFTASNTFTGAASPIAGSVSGTNLGMLIVLTSAVNRSISAPGAGFTTRNDTSSVIGGGAGNTAEEGTVTESLTSTGSEAFSITLNGAANWAAIAATLNPAATIAPVLAMTYTVSAVTQPTSANVTLTTTNTSTLIDVTGDRTWLETDIANVAITLTATVVSASALIDWIYLEITDSTANVARVSFKEMS